MIFEEIDSLILSILGTRTRYVASFHVDPVSQLKPIPVQKVLNKTGIKRRYSVYPYYDPTSDIIYMPAKNRFRDIEQYISCYVHELIHSTGHHTRLNRTGLKTYVLENTPDYCIEEIIAEAGALYFTTKYNLHKPTTQSLAYINRYAKKGNLDSTIVKECLEEAKEAYKFLDF